MFFLAFLFIYLRKLRDLKSQKTINSAFIILWFITFVIILFFLPKMKYFSLIPFSLMVIYIISYSNVKKQIIFNKRNKDPGEKFPWKELSKQGIGLWHSLSIQLLKKNRKIELDQVSKKMFFNNLSKIGYAMKKTENLKNRKFNNYIVKAFQRRFRQELINGKIDKECLIISNNLAKKFS